MNNNEMRFPDADIDAALDRLEKINAVEKYRRIMNLYNAQNFSAEGEYQQLFNGFYRVRRPLEWREIYYGFMRENKGNTAISFKAVLDFLQDKTGRIEASFSAKLLHTIRPELPTWDKWIGNNTDIAIPAYNRKDRLAAAVGAYEDLTAWFKNYENSENGKNLISRFDRRFPDSGITAVRKIDLVLWQIRPK